MKDISVLQWMSRRATFLTAIAITAVFSIRFLNLLPFCGTTRMFNYETINTLVSVFIYNNEPFSFPLGAIGGLTFPFHDANIGNVGAIPLFALFFKALGKIIPYFRTFDYFISLELMSCFITAFFSQKILLALGVRHRIVLALGALLTATSFLILTRSAWSQPFCVASFPLFTSWIYAVLLTLQRGHWSLRQDIFILLLFPIAALVDNYSLVGILLGTGILISREFIEYFFGGERSSRNRLERLLFFCIGGVVLSLFSLYLIGMYPTPPISPKFTSYDPGMGGRYFVADLFAPWIPVANKIYGFVHPSLLGRLGFPLNTDRLAPGQYEGVGYVGSAVLLIWLSLAVAWIFSFVKKGRSAAFVPAGVPTGLHGKLVFYSPWKKTAAASIFVFIFSLGYELHILGVSFPEFSGMPAAWLADSFSPLYNIRATGRLAILFSLFLIFEAVRRLSCWYDKRVIFQSGNKSSSAVAVGVIGLLFAIHFFDVAPFLRPIPAQPVLPVGGIFSEKEILTLRNLAKNYKAVLIGPPVMAVDTKWTVEAFSLGYYLGIPSNLYFNARTIPSHHQAIFHDIAKIMSGDWDDLSRQYGKILFAIPRDHADAIRLRVQHNYEETQIGPLSIWSRRATFDLKYNKE